MFPLLQDMCEDDEDNCLINDYLLFCFDSQDDFKQFNEDHEGIDDVDEVTE